MRILLLAAANSIHTVRWANAFVERGMEVHLASQQEQLEGLSKQVQVHALPHGNGFGYLLNGPRIRSLVATIAPDVVNAHYATGYGTLARWVGNVPLVLNVWGSDVYSFPTKGALHRWWLVENLRRAQRIVSTSEAMAERTRSLVGSDLPITVVPFGVDMQRFHPRTGSSEHPLVTIGTVKTLEPVYGVDRSVEAFILLCGMKGLPQIHLRIVGEGCAREALEQRVKQAGLSDRVSFMGKVPHERVPDELRKLDIYIALSRSESFGVAVVEASACGLPVVVSDVGGLPEVVENGTTGLIIPDGSAELAAKALADLVADPERRLRMGEAGRVRVTLAYDWGRSVDRMIAVLEEVTEHRST